MFIDASALVAIIAREPGFEDIADCMDAAPSRVTSGLAILETVMALRRLGAGTVMEAETLVQTLLAVADIALVPIAEPGTRAAVSAYARYGKEQGHPARLNLADCFAYAAAQVLDVPLLFVGNDFPQTDIRPALV